MRKFAAILLLLLLSFNFVGYRLYFSFLQKKADTALLASLDANQYNEADLITLRVPLNMPYQAYQTETERVDGEITVEGKLYKYVKRKVEAGTLVLWCLPDKQKMQLENAQHQTFKLTNDVPATGKTDAAKSLTFKNLFSDYDQHVQGWGLTPPNSTVYYSRPFNDRFYPLSFLTTPEQPPEAIA